MNDGWLSPAALALALAVFVAVLLLAEGLYLLWQQRFGREATRLQARLQALAGSRQRARQAVARQRMGVARDLSGRLERLPGMPALERLLRQAGLPWRPGAALAASLAAAAGAMALALLAALGSVPVTSLALSAAATPWLYALWRRDQRMERLEQQLPEALDLMVRALRAGHAFSTALQMVGDEMTEPIAGEFRAVHDEVNYGLGLAQAFDNLIARVPLTDLRYFVVAVLIQREAGGNLAELLGNLSALIRARLKLLSRVRVLSSEGRLSGWILVIMPFALGGLLTLLNPDFMRPLWTDPIGVGLLQWMLGLMVAGVLLMRRIIRIRV